MGNCSSLTGTTSQNNYLTCTIRVENIHAYHFDKICQAAQRYQPTDSEESTSSQSTYKCTSIGVKRSFTFRSLKVSLYPEEGYGEGNLFNNWGEEMEEEDW